MFDVTGCFPQENTEKHKFTCTRVKPGCSRAVRDLYGSIRRSFGQNGMGSALFHFYDMFDVIVCFLQENTQKHEFICTRVKPGCFGAVRDPFGSIQRSF